MALVPSGTAYERPKWWTCGGSRSTSNWPPGTSGSVRNNGAKWHSNSPVANMNAARRVRRPKDAGAGELQPDNLRCLTEGFADLQSHPAQQHEIANGICHCTLLLVGAPRFFPIENVVL
jgi:hypothetical protein